MPLACELLMVAKKAKVLRVSLLVRGSVTRTQVRAFAMFGVVWTSTVREEIRFNPSELKTRIAAASNIKRPINHGGGL